jgi:NAD(P)-dependent dehydrogenase (short-subunit alcohol dehydrogenase family)
VSTVYPNRFSGRTAVITGGASGLGKAVAARIVAEGGQVCLWDLDAEGLKPPPPRSGPSTSWPWTSPTRPP